MTLRYTNEITRTLLFVFKEGGSHNEQLQNKIK